jgi:hypothetical protein
MCASVFIICHPDVMNCHPERSEGSAVCRNMPILRAARDGKNANQAHISLRGLPSPPLVYNDEFQLPAWSNQKAT